MKKLYFFVMALLGLSLAACQQGATITVEPATLNFPAEGGQENVSVVGAIGGDIVAEPSADWLTTEVNATIVIIKAAANTESASRNATVTISYQGATQEVAVTQAGLEVDFSGLQTEVNVPSSGGDISLGRVVSNVTPKVEIPVDWITNPVIAEDGSITVTVAANDTEDSRQCVIEVVAGTSQEVTIRQEALSLGLNVTVTLGNQVAGGQEALVSVELVGTTTDFRLVLMQQEAYFQSDPSQIESMILAEGYDKAYYDDLLEAGYEGFPFVCESDRSWVVAYIAMDADGNQTDVIDDVTFTTAAVTPTQEYYNWIGDWEITYYKHKQSTPYKDTISIAQQSEGSTYTLYGWENFYYTADEEGNMAPNELTAAFDPSTSEFVFMGGEVAPRLNFEGIGECLVYTMGIATVDEEGSVSFYLFTGGSLASATYSEENARLDLIPFDTQDNGEDYTPLGIGFIILDMSGNPLSLVTSGLDMWLAPYVLNKVSDTPTWGASSVSANSVSGASSYQIATSSLSQPEFYSNTGKVLGNASVR